MKSYTDLEQSRKLAEILPLESADMFWRHCNLDNLDYPIMQTSFEYIRSANIPCWSLAALLEQFEDEAGLARDYGLWFCYDNRRSYCTEDYNNPIDACYEMIIHLNELKMM